MMRIPKRSLAALPLAALAACLAPAAARAQACPGPRVDLVVRGAGGAPLDSAALEGLSSAPAWTENRPFQIQALRLPPEWTGGASRDTLPVLRWQANSCRLRMDEVRIRQGGREMRLLLRVRLNTYNAFTPGQYLIEAPPFRPGTWRLDVCELPGFDVPGELPIVVRGQAWKRHRGDAARAFRRCGAEPEWEGDPENRDWP